MEISQEMEELPLDDQQVVLMEQSIASSQKLLDENKKLREELEKRDGEHRSALSAVLTAVKELKENQRGQETNQNRGKGKKRRKQSIPIPPACRVSNILISSYS